MSILSGSQDQYRPNIPRLGVSSDGIMQVLCMTWYIQVNLFRIFVLFVPGIKRQKEYCLSLA